MTSRNKDHGYYVGAWAGKKVRRKKMVPPLMVGNEVLFPECKPYVDSGVALLTLRDRKGDEAQLPRWRRRYVAKVFRKSEI